jgi:hypothetical protein
MRVLSNREKIEFFVLSPVFFSLTVALFIFSIWNETVDLGYLLGCLLFAIASARHFCKSSASLWILAVSAGGMHLTQLVFFGFDRNPSEYAIFALQYLAIALMCLSSMTTIVWLVKGKPGTISNQIIT